MRVFFGQSVTGPFVSLSEQGQILGTVMGAPIDDALTLLDRTLASVGCPASAINEVVCDRGPGGFSSVRRRVVVAATLAQALKAGICAVGQLTAEEAASLPSSEFRPDAPLEPLYDRAPNITTPKSTTHLNRV